MPSIVLPPDSALYATFAGLVQGADMVFFAGLPGVGKSLLVQQLALLAAEEGRRVHLLQWDVARQPFETPRYPMIDGATHPQVIRAVGVWSRGAIVQWNASFRARGDMLIGEAPLIGGRFMELVRPADDAAELLLRDRRTQFVLPVPSRDLRAAIEAKRAESIAQPRHENEAHDAPPELLRALWRDLNAVAFRLGLAASAEDAPYSPAIYRALYVRLLSNRRHTIADLRHLLPAAGSVYAGIDGLPKLRAMPAEAAEILARLEAETPADDASAWYELRACDRSARRVRRE